MDKNKIIILTNSNFPYGGASSNYIRNLALGLKINTKHCISVWLQSGNSRPDNEFSGQRRGVFKGIQYFHIGGFSYRPKLLIGKIINDLQGAIYPFFYIILNRNKIDKIFFYNHITISYITSFLICKLLKIQTIKIIPEWYEKAAVATSKLKLIKWYDFIFGMTRVNFHFDALIVLSTYLKNYYQDNGFNKERIIIVPNLVDIEQFRNRLEGENNTIFTIGYSGTPVKKDGILDLFKAFSLLLNEYPKETLLIIGDISQSKSAIPTLQKKAKEYGIPQDKIFFTGLVDFVDVPNWLNKCKMLTLARPSGQFAEAGFPTKLGEYLACKKATVLTKVGDIPLYFKNEVNAILVEPDDPLAICRGFKFLIENPEINETVSTEGFNWVKQNIEYKIITKKIAAFIEKL